MWKLSMGLLLGTLLAFLGPSAQGQPCKNGQCGVPSARVSQQNRTVSGTNGLRRAVHRTTIRTRLLGRCRGR
jgi:hypothetical protein